MARTTALRAIFMEMGLSRDLANKVARRLDGDCWNSWSEDDWAAAFLKWSAEKKSRRLRELEAAWSEIPWGLPDVPGQLMLPQDKKEADKGEQV